MNLSVRGTFRAFDRLIRSAVVPGLQSWNMKNDMTANRLLFWLGMGMLCFIGSIPGRAADRQLPYLKSETTTYSNVTVYSQTERDLYIHHDGGLENIRISDLDEESLRALGLKTEPKESPSAILLVRAKDVSTAVTHLTDSIGSVNSTNFSAWLTQLRQDPQQLVPAGWGWNILAALGLIYLLVCLGLRAICRNAGAPAGALIFVPLLQLLPLLRAARMPLWGFILFFIPVVNIGMQVWWSFAIVKACGKGVGTAIALLLPVVNLLAFIYLAVSKGTAPTEAVIAADPIPNQA